jgi:hypothetical protein
MSLHVALMAAMGARARLAFEREWDKCHALARWQTVIETTFNQPTRPLAGSQNCAADAVGA